MSSTDIDRQEDFVWASTHPHMQAVRSIINVRDETIQVLQSEVKQLEDETKAQSDQIRELHFRLKELTVVVNSQLFKRIK